MNIIALERQTEELPPLLNLLLEHPPQEQCLSLNGYEPHVGLRPHSKHWRKEKDSGCFHITIHKNGKCRMHWDSWDPRRFPVKHFFEILHQYLRFPIRYIRQV